MAQFYVLIPYLLAKENRLDTETNRAYTLLSACKPEISTI